MLRTVDLAGQRIDLERDLVLARPAGSVADRNDFVVLRPGQDDPLLPPSITSLPLSRSSIQRLTSAMAPSKPNALIRPVTENCVLTGTGCDGGWMSTRATIALAEVRGGPAQAEGADGTGAGPVGSLFQGDVTSAVVGAVAEDDQTMQTVLTMMQLPKIVQPDAEVGAVAGGLAAGRFTRG